MTYNMYIVTIDEIDLGFHRIGKMQYSILLNILSTSILFTVVSRIVSQIR